MRSMRTDAVRARFLAALADSGNVRNAAEVAGIGRTALYDWKREDPEFSTAWEDALMLGVGSLEDKAMDYALAGNEKLIMFILQARKPEIYGQRQSIEVSGSVSVNLRHAPLDDLRAELAQLMAPRPLLTLEVDETTNVIPLAPRED